MPTAISIQRGMANADSNTTRTTTPTSPTTSIPERTQTLSEREQLKIEFYKTYDVMTGIRIAATLGGFFSLMVLLVVYKSRCKSNKQLDDPRLTAAAAAAVAEVEAEERALAAALEAIARLPPKPDRGPRRSLCFEANVGRLPPLHPPRFASVGGGYETLLAPPMRQPRLAFFDYHRRFSSVTCSSTTSSYQERRGSAMVMPCLPPPPTFPRHAPYDEPWDMYYPINIQVIQPTPDVSPCGSEIRLHSAGMIDAKVKATCPGRRAPLASMGSVDPPDPDSRSLGSDSVFLNDGDECPDTEDEVSGFSTDSDTPGPSSALKFLKVPPKKKHLPEKWDGCTGCVPRRRSANKAEQTCPTISNSVEVPRSPKASTTTSSSQESVGSPSPCASPIELRHRPPVPLPTTPVVWSQETLF